MKYQKCEINTFAATPDEAVISNADDLSARRRERDEAAAAGGLEWLEIHNFT